MSRSDKSNADASKSSSPESKEKPVKSGRDRADRLSAALRENLKRRKSQAKLRKSAEPETKSKSDD